MTPSDLTQSEPSVREQLAGTFGFFRRALRFWRVLLAAVLLGAIAFGAFSRLRQPKYRSETVILYVEKGDTEQETESSDAQRSITVRLKELLYARPNLERVVTQFNLYPALRKSYGMGDAIEELKKHVDFRAPGGDTFSLAFDGSSASEAQAVTAELGRLVIAGDAELRKSQAKVALDFLVGERQARDAELRAAEEQLAAFMAQHPRFALDATPLASGAAIRATMGAAQAVSVGASRAFVAAPRANDPSANAKIAPQIGAAPPSSGGKAADADEARARAALAAARENLTEKLVHYTPAHPDVRAAEAEVQRATQRLAALTGGAGQAPAPAAQPPAAESPPATQTPTPAAPTPRVAASPMAAPRPALLPPAAAAAAGAAQSLVELETDWLKLTRAVSEARQRLDQIEAQLFRADIQSSTETGGHAVQVTVIDPAFLPQRPLPPGLMTLALIFLAASLVLGAVLALVLAIFDDRLFGSSDAASVADVLVEVPRASGRKAYVTS